MTDSEEETMTMTTSEVPTKGQPAADDPEGGWVDGPAEAAPAEDAKAEEQAAPEAAKEVRYTVLASVDDGRSWTTLGSFKGANQREARQAAVRSNDPLRTAIMEEQKAVQLVAIAKFNAVHAVMRTPEPELDV